MLEILEHHLGESGAGAGPGVMGGEEEGGIVWHGQEGCGSGKADRIRSLIPTTASTATLTRVFGALTTCQALC